MNPELSTLSPAAELPIFGVGERLAEAKRSARLAGLGARFQSLGAVLERLWAFHDAMKTGKPLDHSEEMLGQVGAALRKARKPIG